GLKQRAELLNLIYKDIYGNQELIKKGLLPMELIYYHSGFLRPTKNVFLPGEHQLVLYAADMSKGPDGRMWILNDRSQAPSGSGYTLENRSVMSRVLPDLLKDREIRKLSNFFSTLRNTLNELAPYQKANPRIVLLTPGPRNETYFEHAYLASYLGYTLVQGEDLMARDGFIWLKSLSGLEKVDIILRRVDDSFCDPLELREDSQLGVSGLLEVMRMGNVSVVNPLGSSILENNGILGFLPNIAKYYFNEELILPHVATWWCGQKKERDYVIQHMDELVIKYTDRQISAKTFFGGELSKKQKEELTNQIMAHPHLYVGQERVSFSTVPSYVNDVLEPRFAVVRNFLVSTKSGYSVMPGGLTRSAPGKGIFIVSNQAGGTSKDTWIISPEPPKPTASKIILPNQENTSRFAGSLPSRTAENLFWVGRYAERALGTARLLRVVLRYANERNRSEQDAEKKIFKSLLAALTHLTMTYPGFVGKNSEKLLEKPEKELLSVTLDNQRPGSLAFNISNMMRSIYAVRDRWSMDTWRAINNIQELIHTLEKGENISLREVQNTLDMLITGIVSFHGHNRESMTRELGWMLLETGRKLELCQLMISTMRSTLVAVNEENIEYALQEAVLNVNEGLITYRYRYRSHLQLSTVIDMVLTDLSYPRSLAFQVDQVRNHMKSMPRKFNNFRLEEDDKLLLNAYTQLTLCDPVKLATTKKDEAVREELDELLYGISELLSKTSDVITRTYFSHIQPIKQLNTPAADQEI
ncbi:MAG: circularly permuted type 2 ATP-grasp protein, partial [Cytophagales bacterium]|nr:circularly permuted type 2 ATP-grasp protein [Cytophagales bacterium]